LEIDFRIGSTEEILESLVGGRISLAVLCAKVDDRKFTVDPFLEDEIVGIAKPGRLPGNSDVVPPEALNGDTLLLQEEGSSTRQAALGLGALDAVSWRKVWELGSTEAIKRGARAGLGVGFVSWHVLTDEIKRGELSAFRLAETPPMLGYVSVVKPRIVPTGPVERAFLETLADCMGRLPGSKSERPLRVVEMQSARRAGPQAL
jgi:DNA-binding transcriptional LysR family regulator